MPDAHPDTDSDPDPGPVPFDDAERFLAASHAAFTEGLTIANAFGFRPGARNSFAAGYAYARTHLEPTGPCHVDNDDRASG